MVLSCCIEQYILSNLILPSDVAKHLCVAQDLAKINVVLTVQLMDHFADHQKLGQCGDFNMCLYIRV